MHVNDPEFLIIERIRSGDSIKYSVLVDRYKDRGLALALRILGTREDAEETLQDAFLRAFRNLGRFRCESAFGTWFYRILYNLCLTRRRRMRGERAVVILDDEIPLDLIMPDAENSDASDIASDRQVEEILHAEIERLPEKYRIPLTLFYMQELRYEEISAIMGVPLGTVKTNIFRARLRLRGQMLKLLTKEEMMP